jgi:mRNA-degrading endonuclease RelE of RelBE toxin-antitoxin system
MVKYRIIFSEKAINFIEKSNSGLKSQIKKKFQKLKENNLVGDFLFGINNIDCREIKIEGLRFFTIQYRNQNFVLDVDEFKNVIKVLDYARKNKSKEQQIIINDIKERLKKFGLNI